ncbi:Zn-dependent peptidase ImmA (M78 family) [Virgibacillus natechei]|uniref:Zn-dependent peptidase ImmA (M78 family) n=1 Tax=Virgibacillus natechei TaxID=1216297 RepID=A0ABS4IL29_9BACI|nr:ImmA/IrrE family metallo-endopeptidase [Virgibacillus natechei]MBP1971641.1 Zn-dependent peptidase ImmA (M78 family) [Virgibacillus natechei]UZD13033.1 ImmA/IrrE family metallo-endopeptidase [Virgibacillus natechei]
MNYTITEDCIRELYRSLKISDAGQLEINNIADKLDLKVCYANVSFRFENIIVLKSSNKEREWQEFGHELAHYLGHTGNQAKMYYMFRDLQEDQANHFAYHFCVPTFMLQKERNLTVYRIMNLFNVEYEFAFNRLEMYERKMIDAGVYNQAR